MIGNLQNELYLENKQENGAKICANIRQTLEGEKGSKIFFRILERKICKFKQYLNYILLIINQNILRTYLNL